ncbi:hypothetical protein BN2497_13033 [Janthinobacterium sp. CG23_2]|nr:hypothetical protein BN2497_13033 [Janthinobacterium sp. CG23_2]CUU32914.1 hypothetical protein BN3177_13033 [Janthinobacterium sp. CG23_2]
MQHGSGLSIYTNRMEAIMKIPDELQIPAVVFALQAALLFGVAMIFLVLSSGI